MLQNTNQRERCYCTSPQKYSDLSQHPTFKTIEKLYADYTPEVVIVEGIDTGEELSPQSILDYADKCTQTQYKSECGESFFSINQARTHLTHYITGEPTDRVIKAEINRLGYKDEDLLGFYLVRQIPQLKRRGQFNKKSFEKKADELSVRFKRKMGSQVTFGYAEFSHWYSKNMANPKSVLDIQNDDAAPHGGTTLLMCKKYPIWLPNFAIKRSFGLLNACSIGLTAF